MGVTIQDLIQMEMDAASQEVATLGKPELMALLIALRQIEALLSDGIAAWLKEIPDTGVKVSRRHLRDLNRKTKQARAMFKALRYVLGDKLQAVSKEAVGMSDVHVTKQYRAFSSAHDEPWEPADRDLEAAQTPQTPKTPRALLAILLLKHRRQAKKYAAETERGMRRQLEISRIQGESIDAMVKRIARLASGKSATLPEGMAHGLTQKGRSDASRLVRTEAIHAYNSMQVEGIKGLLVGDPSVRKRWDATLDRKGCPVCRRLDGEIQEVGDAFSTGSMQSPEHPHCRCTIVAWSTRWSRTMVKNKAKPGKLFDELREIAGGTRARNKS